MKELELIRLISDLPDYGLKAGDRGTIVLVYNQGEAYKVEFIKVGSTVAVATLDPEQIQPWDPLLRFSQ